MQSVTVELHEQGGPGDDPVRPSLVVTLETPIPYSLPPGRATAVFILGTCFDREREITRLGITVDGTHHRVDASRMPRTDRFHELHPTIADKRPAGGIDHDSELDPNLHAYRSGFWTTIPIPARQLPGRIELRLVAEFEGGGRTSAALTEIEVVVPAPPPSLPASTPEVSAESESQAGGDLVAICMATYNPDIELFKVQIDSIRNQTDTDWVCLLSDDRSDPESFREIEAVVGDDARFVVSRSEIRLGFYRNFERTLGLVPEAAAFVALSDQDDRWYPEKLATLRASLGDARLVYSDLRMVDRDGLVLADSLWVGRRNNHTNFASLLISNTVAGAASMFHRSMLEMALPFPEGPGWQFHDHWLGCVAMATGKLAYVDRPLYDYVQHANAITGQVAVDASEGAEVGEEPDRANRRRRILPSLPRGFFGAWQIAYFRAYLQLQLQAAVLLSRCPDDLDRRRRRSLGLLSRADSSVLGPLWLTSRMLRPLIGRNETLGTEQLLLRGLLWRRLIGPRSRGQGPPDGKSRDAGLPAFDMDKLGSNRIKRWRANL